jgi:hypothetical protein
MVIHKASRNVFETVLSYTPITINSERKIKGTEVVNKEITTEMQTRTTSTDVHLRGGMLLMIRVVWLAFALFNLVLISINVLQPFFGGQLSICPFTFTCPADTQTLTALQQAHISLPTYIQYVTLLGFFSASLFL